MFPKMFKCFIISLVSCVYEALTISVDTPVGQIRGLLREDYIMFLGVPYGLVDETNPFGNAKPHPYFKTPHEAFDDSTICPQYEKRAIKGNIQCLHLNIYKPNVTHAQTALPVMVYIHGGTFVEGNGALSTFSPKYLMRHEVILVTVNYRLGPYGHLCLPHTEYSNQALKDQTLALRWVKNNIGSFGGDPDNILFFGHSSGSISVHFHLLFDKDILFNKVILQSGVAVSSLVNQVTDVKTFVKDVGLDDENIDVDRFIQTVSTIDTDTVINITKFYDFRPCIDGEFISKAPRIRNLNNLKLLIGGTSKETLYYYPSEDPYNSFDFVAELNKGFSVSKMADSSEAIDVIKYFYEVDIVDFTSDISYNYPMERTVGYYVQNKCTVYRYLFSYDGGRNYMKVRDSITAPGSTHADELGYLFDMPLLQNTTAEDQVIIDRMTTLWTNFAKFGDPTPKTSHLLPVKWTPVTAGKKHYLQIDTNLVLHNGRPFEDRMVFWDLFYEKYGKYAKGISLGEKFMENKTTAADLSTVLLLISVLLLWL